MNVHLGNISTAETSVTKLGMVMQHYGPKCHARRLVCYLQIQGVTVQAHLIKYDRFFHICWSAYLFATKFDWWYIIISWSVLCKNQIVFKAKITVKVENLIESFCILYLLYHWSLCNQNRCVDLLFMITKTSTTKWVFTDSSTLTDTIARLTIRGYFATQGD